MRNFEYLMAQLRKHGDRTCMQERDASYTYGELLDQFERWGEGFDALSVEAGSVVGLRADYSLHTATAILALLARRAVVALIPRDREPDRYLSDACVELYLELELDGSYRTRALGGCKRHALIEKLRESHDGGIVIFTSGSTAAPKAALHSGERFLRKFARPCRSLNTLAFLLLDHVAGLDTLFYTLSAGGTLVLTRQREPRAIGRLIQENRVEVLPTSPSFLRLLCAAGVDGSGELSSLRVITYGSEAMDPGTLARLNQRFPGIQIMQKYGSTEVGAPKSVCRGDDSLWIKIRNDDVETRIIDNILWLRSTGALLGYLNAPSPLSDDGWYCTGDLVEVDGEWLRFCGRAADVINVGGQKVSPAEVEEQILQLNFVRDAVVAGEPHPLLGQIVTARVVLDSPQRNSKEAIAGIRRHCQQHLASYKVPMRVEITAEGLVNDRQKIRRKKVMNSEQGASS